MKIKELVEKSGMPRTTIHYYLRQGLLHPPSKTGRTMAYYNDSHLRRLKQIEGLKKGARVPISLLKERVNAIYREASSVDDQCVDEQYDVTKPVATTKEKEKKRREIIKQAIRIFKQQGYHQTKVLDITSALNISTGTFYIYFRNKQDLFIEVIDDVFKQIVGEAAAAIKGEKDFVKRLIIRGRVFYKNYTQYSEILNQLRAEMAGENQWPAQKIQKIYHGLTKPLIREINDAVNNGVIKKIDADLLAYSLTGTIEMMSLRLSLDSKYDLDNVIRFIIGLMINPLVLRNDKAKG